MDLDVLLTPDFLGSFMITLAAIAFMLTLLAAIINRMMRDW